MLKNIGIFLALLLSASISIGQLSTENADTQVSALSGTDGAVTLSSHIDVINSGSSQIEVACMREILVQDAPAANERFCWGGLCFGNGTEVSPINDFIPANSTVVSEGSDGFTGYYEYNGEDGICQIKYTFFEVDNPENKTEVIVTYCVDSFAACDAVLSTEELVAEDFTTNLSPNPASENFIISYQIGNSLENASVIVYNALGSEITRVSLDSKNGAVNFEASEFETGMYFYRIENNGEASSTKRFIVSH